MSQRVLPAGAGRRNLLGGTNQATRRLGSGCRIYRNVADIILALDQFEVTINTQQLPSGPIMFHRSVDSIHVSRMLIHLDQGSRVVSTIQMIGDYSSITTDAGDYLIVTWDANSVDENDVVISFEDKVSKVGDSV